MADPDTNDRAGITRARSESPSQEAPRLVFTTAPDRAVAERIARALIERRLAACVNILPAIRSVYRWKGAVEEADEVLLLAKTTAGRVSDVELALAELHPYEVPECVALALDRVEEKYLAWLVEASGPSRTTKS
jgi:periplasmic divalent cation tolerance protein